MPNYCLNELTVRGSKTQIVRFLRAAQEKTNFAPYPLSLQSLFPYPLDSYCRDERWGWENWGTGCDICEAKDVWWESDNEIIIAFLTSYTPCNEAFTRKIAPDFPELTFHLKYDEPLMRIRGEYEWQEGKLVKEIDRSWPRLRNRK